MKQFDSRNIDKRAAKLLDHHAGLLGASGIPFIKENGNYYLYEKGSEDYMKMGYSKRKKLLSRTFNLEIQSIIHNVDFSQDFQLKLQFKGFPNITGADFKGNKKDRGFESMFQQQDLLDAILKEARKVEIAYIYIQYHKASQKMEIRVCPYAGAFLWIIFPPVFYDMRLKEEEIFSLYKTAKIITDYMIRSLE